jgi:hypothetical protein
VALHNLLRRNRDQFLVLEHDGTGAMTIESTGDRAVTFTIAGSSIRVGAREKLNVRGRQLAVRRVVNEDGTGREITSFDVEWSAVWSP